MTNKELAQFIKDILQWQDWAIGELNDVTLDGSYDLEELARLIMIELRYECININ